MTDFRIVIHVILAMTGMVTRNVLGQFEQIRFETLQNAGENTDEKKSDGLASILGPRWLLGGPDIFGVREFPFCRSYIPDSCSLPEVDVSGNFPVGHRLGPLCHSKGGAYDRVFSADGPDMAGPLRL